MQRGDCDQRGEQVAPAAAQGAKAEEEAQEELLRKVHSIWFIWERAQEVMPDIFTVTLF